MMRNVMITAAVTVALAGCAETGAFFLCSMANARHESFSGRVNGERVKGDVSWTAGPGDPGYVEPAGCIETMATNIRRANEGKQNCLRDAECPKGWKCLPDLQGGRVCQTPP